MKNKKMKNKKKRKIKRLIKSQNGTADKVWRYFIGVFGFKFFSKFVSNSEFGKSKFQNFASNSKFRNRRIEKRWAAKKRIIQLFNLQSRRFVDRTSGAIE